MKKLPVLFLMLLISSCDRKDRKSVHITEFNEIIRDSLEPYDNKISGYAMHNIYIKGYVNDSIKINFGQESESDKYSTFLKDTIDTRLYRDYYGEGNAYFYLDPYKATAGELEIRHSLD